MLGYLHHFAKARPISGRPHHQGGHNRGLSYTSGDFQDAIEYDLPHIDPTVWLLQSWLCTGWPFHLCKTSSWHQDKSSALAWPALAWPGQSGTFVLKSTGGFAQVEWSPCTAHGLGFGWLRFGIIHHLSKLLFQYCQKSTSPGPTVAACGTAKITGNWNEVWELLVRPVFMPCRVVLRTPISPLILP